MSDAAPPQGQLDALETGVAESDLAPPELLRLSGPAHLEALDRIVSQSVKALRPGEGRLALLLAPKGQFRALMAVFGGRDEAVVAAPAGRGGELAAGLGKYLAFSKAKLEPIGAAAALGVFGPRWPVVAAACGADTEVLARGGACEVAAEGGAVRWLGRAFAGIAGVVAVSESVVALGGVRAEAIAQGALSAGAGALELARIEAGWPAWGAELTEDVLPAEVGLEAVAVSFTKGCYVGQESVARMRTYGHPNRLLVSVTQVEGPGGVPIVPLTLELRDDGRRRGALTSVARHPERGAVGLALVRREGAVPGAVWLSDGRAFQVDAHPLVAGVPREM
ncbi:MAG: YgfZ/GcvT domain-containing protein [Acidobacteriota bacterium]